MDTDDLDIIGNLPPMHPGEFLREEYLVPLNLSAGRLAKACGVPRTRIERIAEERVGITADTALRLGRVLGTTDTFWTNLQKRYEREVAVRALGDTLASLEPIIATTMKQAA